MKRSAARRSSSEERTARQWKVEKLVKGTSPLWIRVIIFVLQIWFFIYDYLNYIPYKLLDSPKRKLERSKRIKARSLRGPAGPWRNVEGFLRETFPGVDTVDKLFTHVTNLYYNRPMLGTREVLSIEEEELPDGKIFEKWELGVYRWQTYGEVHRQVGLLAAGLKSIAGKDPKVVIFAETRADWLISALACFRANLVIVTVYATLGEPAIVEAINETAATILVTSAELLPKVKDSCKKCPTLKTLIHLPLVNKNKKVDLEPFHAQFERVLSLEELEKVSSEPIETSEAKKDDLALIMYTSGTTGDPKGVMITHENVIGGIAGMSTGAKLIGETDTIICYLPLAHIFELLAELCCVMLSCRIGYSSALTLHDRATKIKAGTHGDCYALRPTVICGVPTIWDRVFKAVSDEIATTPRIMQEIFKLYYERKRARYEEGYRSPFLDRIIFKRISALLGGNLKVLISGGAALNPETQRFLKACMCCTVIQGYGLTETSAAAAISDPEDLTTGTSGPPLRCSQFILREWEEGDYSPENYPPQGEILIGGPTVAMGYWRQPEKTAESFLVIEGVRYFATGDIGEIRDDGSLIIIDRKKDLVKLPHGDYIALAKVESALYTSPLIDNVCVYGSPLEPYLIALIVPNQKNLQKIADDKGIQYSEWQELCKNKNVLMEYKKSLDAHALKNHLLKWEIPGKIYLCEEVWTPDSGLLTEAMKLKRLPIKKKYASIIDMLYERNGD